MQSFDYWPSRPDSPSGCTVQPNSSIPFRVSSLPLFARARIRSPPPSTPPKKFKPMFAPRSIPLTPTSIPRYTTPPLEEKELLTPPPTPIPFSTFSQPPTTPGLSFDTGTSLATPSSRGTRLITPITPTHIRYDERGIARDDSEYGWSPLIPVRYDPWSNYGGFEDQEALLRKMQSPTTTNLTAPWYGIRPAIEQVEEVTLDIPRARPKMLHHVSSDGGPIAALKRYILACKDEELGGMSLFLHCPKKRVPDHSIARIRKERKIAMEWNQLLRVSSE